MPTPRVVIVIPCFNEERRLDPAEFLRLVQRGDQDVHLLFVDDGSTDGTGEALAKIRDAAPTRVAIRTLERNTGKAEAVRIGLRDAVDSNAPFVGYADADLSTPVDELLRMVETITNAPIQALLGARVRLLGTSIDRRPVRHYLGRVFATIASLALRLPIYDTQCGAKLFARTPTLVTSLERPFRSRWIFDVELLSRLTAPSAGAQALRPEDIREIPLREWREVSGSKLTLRAMIAAGLHLLALLLRRRRAARRTLPAAESRGPTTSDQLTP